MDKILEIIESSSVAHTVYWCNWSKMDYVEHPYAVVMQSEIPNPFFNNIFSANIPHSKAQVVVDDLVDRFRSRQVPCFWWSGPVNHDLQIVELLESHGFAEVFDAPAMAIDLSRELALKRVSAEIIELQNKDQMADWTQTCSAAYGFDETFSLWWDDLFTNLPFGGSKPLRQILAYCDDKPVATASLFIDNGVASLANVGVRDGFRRRGIGSAMTITALQIAQALGCRWGVLFSSPMGISMYESIGFRQYGEGHCYSWSPESS